MRTRLRRPQSRNWHSASARRGARVGLRLQRAGLGDELAVAIAVNAAGADVDQRCGRLLPFASAAIRCAVRVSRVPWAVAERNAQRHAQYRPARRGSPVIEISPIGTSAALRNNGIRSRLRVKA